MVETRERRTERLLLTIPIRVLGLDSARGEFCEDTHTVMVNHTGARIALKHQVFPGDSLRIVNLENSSEADFRIVGPMHLGGAEVTEWGVECLDSKRNIWGIEFSPPLAFGSSEAAALLECRPCGKKVMWIVSLMDVEVLDSTGMVPLDCAVCGKLTYWAYADIACRPREFSPSEPTAPPPRPVEVEKQQGERRAHKRLRLKLAILVRSQNGEEEITKTENLTKRGVAAILGIDLSVGERVNIVCPFTPGGQKIEQTAEVRWRDAYPLGFRRTYGFRYIP